MPPLKEIGKGAVILIMLGVAGFGVFCSYRSTSEPQPWALPIVPHPQEIRLKDERQSFTINQHTQLQICPHNEIQDNLDVQFIHDKLAFYNLNRLKTIPTDFPSDTNNIVILLEKNHLSPLLKDMLSRKGLGFSQDYPGPEGYILEITPDYALIIGDDLAGRFYGIQSLLQLLFRDAHSSQVKIRASTIIDYPDMPLRSAFYGFYLNAMEDDSLVSRAYQDFKKIARYKLNMIDLASHHYGHVEMETPEHPDEKLWQRFAKLHEAAQGNYLQPRVGGWAKWVNTNSPWGADLTTLECIRTTQTIKLNGAAPCTLKIASGQDAPNVIYDVTSGHSWEKEPVTVTNIAGDIVFQEGRDYAINFAPIRSEDYRKYEKTSQTYLEVLFSKVYDNEGEPDGFPLRRAETFNLPATIRRLAGGRIRDGETVTVTFSYIGPDPYSLLKVRYCRSDERLHTDGPENYIWRWCTDPVRFWGANDFCLDVDETRVLAFDKRCMDSGKTSSQIWADDIRYYYQTIRKANPTTRISLWSDMLDPAHNATAYQTEEAAALLKQYGMTDIIMIPWNDDFAEKSVRFFFEQGFPLMPSCQNRTEDGISDAPLWAMLLRNYYQSSSIPSGLMHCRWGYGFDSPDAWEHLATVADHAWSIAPYILHSPMLFAEAHNKITVTAFFESDRYVFDGKNIRQGPLELEDASLYYRSKRDEKFIRIPMMIDGQECRAVIPASLTNSGLIEYYLSMSDKFHTSNCPKPGDKMPFQISIIPANK